MRKLILAVFAAWIAVWIVALPSAADAQQRGDGQGRPRGGQIQDGGGRGGKGGGGGGGFSGVLEGIAGPRLNRAHVDKRDRSERAPQGGGGDFRQSRGGGGGGGGGDRDRNGRGR